jgi:TRAP-type C4-dicarboxylate transport system substrate-binding protein
MHDVIPEPTVFSVPFLFDDEKQVDCAFEKVRAAVEASLDRRGLVALQWSRIGAVHMFCTKALGTPAEMKGAKMWAWEGDPKSVEAFRVAGFTPVVLSSADIYASLQTGMIDCVPSVPLYALTTRTFEKASHMLGVPWSYVIGATLVRKETWEKIPSDLRPRLVAVAVELGAKVDTEVKKLNADAVAAMQKQGLTVMPSDLASWRPSMERAAAVVRGGSVPAPFFDQTTKARDACR